MSGFVECAPFNSIQTRNRHAVDFLGVNLPLSTLSLVNEAQEVLRGRGTVQTISLAIVAAPFTQERDRALVVDSFGGGFEPE